MLIKLKKTELEIYIKNQKHDFDINKDIDINLIRNYFNGTIGKLSQKHNSLEYWLMRLSERNTLVHNLFLDVCRIYLLNSLVRQHQDIEVHTNNIALYAYFSKAANISLKDRLTFELKRLLLSNKLYLQVVKFALKKFIFNMKYKNKNFATPLHDVTVIQTWVSDGNFNDDSFKDSYYGNLADYLIENGKKVIIWPVFYNVKDESKVVEFIRKYNDSFIFIEDYLKPIDYLVAIKHFMKKRFLNLGKVVINNDDFTKVFHYYQNKESVEMASLFYSFIKRLSENGSKNITFIQNHENMIPEKALIVGVKKYLPDSKHIGYFHTTKPTNQLCLEYATKEEYEIAPKPALVIFNSDIYKKYFENKYPKIDARNGVSFKQLHLKNKPLYNEIKFNKILVLFSGTNDEISLVFDLLNNLKNEYQFIFRMHPMNRFDVQKYYKNNNYVVENEISLNSLISKVTKVISTYSAVAVESALTGLNVGLLYNKKELLINPFDGTNIKNYQLISTSEELEEFLSNTFENVNAEQIFNIEDKDYNIFLEVT